MATIDQYKHKLLDFFICPSDYNLVNGNNTRQIAIYQLEQDIPFDEYRFDGMKGDILVGGGSGEAESFRISKKAIPFFKEEDFDDYEDLDEIFKSFWSSNFSYVLGNGLLKLGWTPDESMEFWLAEKIIDQLLDKKISF